MAGLVDLRTQDDFDKSEMPLDAEAQQSASIAGINSEAPVASAPGMQSPKSGSAPKKIKKDSKGLLEIKVPLARAKRIMKSDKEVKLISNDAAHLACKATV
jgi:hypothetical protein